MIICGGCSAELPDRSKFCLECGTPVNSSAKSVAQERKTVTSLFCDLVAFTAMSEVADPEDVDAMLGRYFTVARSAIEAFGGVVEKFIGDAVVGVFGVPGAHEDDPERAVRAGLRIVEAVEGLTRPDGSPLQLRVGINTGEALVRLDVTPGSGEGFITGDAVNTAARIQSVAPVMGVAVGRTSYEATKLVFDYHDLGPSVVKGKTEAVEVWQAVASLARFGTDVKRRHDTPLVGREFDLALLKGVFDKTVALSSPQLVVIVGEPGLGKSRLVSELFAHVDAQPGLVTWRQGRCLPYGDGITFWALGEIVKAHAGIFDTDPTDVALAKLDRGLPDTDERMWLRQRLLPLLGLEASSTAEQAELFTAWCRFLEHIAEAGPTVLVFEDLHWADAALLGFVEHLTENTHEIPLLILGTARPELFEHHPNFGHGLHNSTPINLAPLTEHETARLVAALLETFAVPDELLQPLVQRAGGNPLFAEEYVRLLQDEHLVERVGDSVQLRRDVQLPLPDNVHALIAARLDTLSPGPKALLADAAVVGKVFWAGAVAAMADRAESDVDATLRDLSHKELVRPVHTSSMSGEQEYTFWHMLTRDVAYAQLPRSSRVSRHLAAAAWIEGRSGKRVEDQADVLAHHYVTALDLAVAAGDVELAGQIRPTAVTYLEMAGERAVGLDTSSATVLLSRAVELTPDDHPGRSRILLTYGNALLHAGRTADAEPVLEQALALFEAAGDVRGAATSLNQLALVYSRRNDPRWVTLPERVWSMLQPLPPGPEHVRALTELSATAMLLNQQETAIDRANQALALAEHLNLDPPARALGFRGGARCARGDKGGLIDFHDALAGATAAGQGREVAVMYINLAGATDLLLGPAAALEASRAGIAYAQPRGLSDPADLLGAGSLDQLLDLGRLGELITAAGNLAARLAASGNERTLLWVRVPQIIALARTGQADQALDWLDWVVDAAQAAGDPEGIAMGFGAAAQGHVALGQNERATILYTEICERQEVHRSLAAARQLTSWVRDTLHIGEPSMAEQLTIALTPDYPQVEHALVTARAALACHAGSHAIAHTAYLEAAQRWHDFTNSTEEAFALREQGRCLISLNRADEAVPVLQRARDMFATMGARPARAETESLLASTAQA